MRIMFVVRVVKKKIVGYIYKLDHPQYRQHSLGTHHNMSNTNTNNNTTTVDANDPRPSGNPYTDPASDQLGQFARAHANDPVRDIMFINLIIILINFLL